MKDEDPVIDRIRKVRHQISAEHGHDTKRLIAHYIELQKKYADRIVRDVKVVTDKVEVSK